MWGASRGGSNWDRINLAREKVSIENIDTPFHSVCVCTVPVSYYYFFYKAHWMWISRVKRRASGRNRSTGNRCQPARVLCPAWWINWLASTWLTFSTLLESNKSAWTRIYSKHARMPLVLSKLLLFLTNQFRTRYSTCIIVNITVIFIIVIMLISGSNTHGNNKWCN